MECIKKVKNCEYRIPGGGCPLTYCQRSHDRLGERMDAIIDRLDTMLSKMAHIGASQEKYGTTVVDPEPCQEKAPIPVINESGVISQKTFDSIPTQAEGEVQSFGSKLPKKRGRKAKK